jgi:hypothetical protein
MPQDTSQADTPTRPGAAARPVIEHRPDSVTGNIDRDQPRITLAQFVGVEPRTRGGARRQVLDEHVGRVDDPVEQVAVGRVLDIGGQRFLAAIEPDEIGAFAVHDGIVGAGEIALLALDLDHPCAGIGQPR